MFKETLQSNNNENSQSEKPSEVEKEKDFFDSSLDQQELLRDIDRISPYEKKVGDTIFFSKQINNDLSYLVSSNGQFINFYLKNDEGEELASFKFKNEKDNFSLEHRYLDKKLHEFGINGGKFLKKAEEVLETLLMAGNNNKIKEIKINAAQTGLVRWAIKNAYKFKTPEEEKLYDDIIKNASQDYIITDEFAKGEKYKDYIFKRDNLSEVREYLEEQLSKGEDRDSIDLRKFTKRFDLVKSI